MDKLKAMQTFVAIADAGSLTAAAAAMGGSLPAVVRSLAALEAELGARLFHRTTRRIALSEEGRRYLERCRHVLQTVAEADAELRAEQREPQGRLVLTAPVLFGQLHVADAVTRFVQRHPKVHVDLHLLDRVVNLVEEGIDVGIRIGVLDDSSLVALPVGRMRGVVVATPAYLKRHGRPQHPKDLRQHECLRFLGNDAPWWRFQEAGKTFNVTVQGPLASNNTAALAQACVAGLGIGSFISYQVATRVREGTLRVVLEDFELPPRPVSLVYAQTRHLPARTRALIDWMQQALQALSEIWPTRARAAR